MPYKRYSLPEERPDAREGTRQWLRRSWPSLVALILPCATGWLWNGVVRELWAGTTLLTLIAATPGYLLWHGWHSRQLDTNHGNFRRHAEPRRYWLSMSLLALFYLLALAGLYAMDEC